MIHEYLEVTAIIERLRKVQKPRTSNPRKEPTTKNKATNSQQMTFPDGPSTQTNRRYLPKKRIVETRDTWGTLDPQEFIPKGSKFHYMVHAEAPKSSCSNPFKAQVHTTYLHYIPDTLYIHIYILDTIYLHEPFGMHSAGFRKPATSAPSSSMRS